MGHLSMPAPSASARTCKPWCVHHDAEIGLCFGEDIAVPGDTYAEPLSVGLSYEPGVGTVIAIADTYLPLAEAKGFALALFRQIEKAQATEPRPLAVIA
ncbi:hypothetical protein [Sphaerisporangium dianthi]|uniref:Uncharacterized protein n=1 Tax=Sphaerisporangium dianthi TaxID=1436120 RepID=A0ABV9CSB4_9ACTN